MCSGRALRGYGLRGALGLYLPVPNDLSQHNDRWAAQLMRFDIPVQVFQRGCDVPLCDA